MSALRFRRAGAIGYLILLSACNAPPPREEAATVVHDDFGMTIALAPLATRIISLNPTTTEILFAIGAGARLVGRSSWDRYPPAALAVAALGDALRPNVEALLERRPDLVVLYASNDNRDAANRLRAAGIRTVALRIDSIAQFARATVLLGRLTGDSARAAFTADTVLRTLARVRAATQALPRPRVFWKTWDTPLLAIGGGSFISELIEIAGGHNIFADLPAPSPPVTLEDVVKRDPDFVVSMPGAVERLRASASWRALRAVREQRILLADTMVTERPGVRLGEAAVSLARLLHPGARP
jgi:ABC-type Fe3+-hydroxamate transport system substrate-binding protein